MRMMGEKCSLSWCMILVFRVTGPRGRAPLRQGAHSMCMIGEECSLRWCRV